MYSIYDLVLNLKMLLFSTKLLIKVLEQNWNKMFDFDEFLLFYLTNDLVLSILNLVLN